MIEGSGIGVKETVHQPIPEEAGELLKKIAKGESCDKNAPYLEMLEACGYVKDGSITQSGNNVLLFFPSATVKTIPKSRIKKI